MIYDCFTFFNELELLEIRLNELDSVVDYFVLVEANFTFQNNSKELYNNTNKSLFEKFNHKIIHVILEDCPIENPSSWELEYYQRNSIVKGLTKCNLNDIILISDLDEIPKAEIVEKLILSNKKNYFLLDTLMYCLNVKEERKENYKYFFLSTLSKKYKNKYLKAKYFCGPVMLRFCDLTTPQEIRDSRDEFNKNCNLIENGGWHFTYQGGVNNIVQKLKSFAHSEYNNDEFTDPKYIENRIIEGKFFLENNNSTYTKLSSFESLPIFVQNNMHKLEHLFSK